MTKNRQNSSIYRECIKNHAAKLGGHAVDGCGEYIPQPSSNPSDPTSLTCAACDCHRNFHSQQDHNGSYKLTDEAEEEATGSQVLKSGSGSVKRHRSNFSREQKEAMVELAEKVGWSLKKREDGQVEEGCKRIGVERGVFKIWMHNHKKQFLASKSEMITNEPVGVNANGNVDGGEEKHLNNSSTAP